MGKTIIVYGSTTGNTLTMAEAVKDVFVKHKKDVKLVEVTGIKPVDLKAYDLILLGCSTWGEGELQDDFISFEHEMKGVDLNGKKAACFGPGDSDYSLFCEAVTILEGRLQGCGATIVTDGLKIDGDVDSQLSDTEEWAEKVISCTA